MLSAVSKAESIYITLLLALPLVYHMPSLLPWNKNPRGFDLMFVSPQIQDGLGLKNEVPQKVETRNISRKLQESVRLTSSNPDFGYELTFVILDRGDRWLSSGARKAGRASDWR